MGQETKEMQKNRKKSDKITTSPHISMITLNVNGLISPIKRHKVVGWIKNKTQQYAASRKHISALKTNTGLE